MSHSYHHDYVAPMVARALAFLPRLGHSRDITVFLSGDFMAMKDYIVGLIFAGSFALAFFALWGVALCVWMCLGQRRVGCLSGHPFVVSPTIEDEENDHDLRLSAAHTIKEINLGVGANDGLQGLPPLPASPTRKRRLCGRHTGIRFAFLLAGAMFVAASTLMMTQGVLNLQRALSTFHESSETVNDIVAEIESIHEENLVGLTGANTANLRDVLVQELGDPSHFCPGDSSLQNSAGARHVAQRARETAILLDNLGSFLSKETAPILDLTARIGSASTSIQRATNLSLTDWKALAVLIPCIMLPAFLMFVTMLRLCGYSRYHYDCPANWVIVPLFVLLVVAICVAQVVVSIATIMNADFCLGTNVGYNSPDATVLSIVEGVGFGPETDVYGAIDYYVNQCDPAFEDPFQPILDYKPIVEDTKKTLRQIDDAIFRDEEFMQELSRACDRDFAELKTPLGGMEEVVLQLEDATDRMLELFDCEKIVNLYTATIYDGTCTSSVTGAFWIYCCTMVMAFCGMLMLTMRASYKVTQDPEDYQYDIRSETTSFEDCDEIWEPSHGNHDGLRDSLGSTIATTLTRADPVVPSAPFNPHECTPTAPVEPGEDCLPSLFSKDAEGGNTGRERSETGGVHSTSGVKFNIHNHRFMTFSG